MKLCTVWDLSLGVSSMLQILWAAAARGEHRDTEEIKGCYWSAVHTLILWCPYPHSCKVRCQTQTCIELCTQLSTLQPETSIANICIYNVQTGSIDFSSMHLLRMWIINMHFIHKYVLCTVSWVLEISDTNKQNLKKSWWNMANMRLSNDNSSKEINQLAQVRLKM